MIRYNTIQYDTIRYDLIQYDSNSKGLMSHVEAAAVEGGDNNRVILAISGKNAPNRSTWQ